MVETLHAIVLALLTPLLTLVPAPRATPPSVESPPHPLVGGWALDWSEHCLQSTILHADGTCDSPEYGAGVWSQDADGYVWFSERGDQAHYCMWFDIETGVGSGWTVDATTGEISGGREIRIRRGERLPPPRVFE